MQGLNNRAAGTEECEKQVPVRVCVNLQLLLPSTPADFGVGYIGTREWLVARSRLATIQRLPVLH